MNSRLLLPIFLGAVASACGTSATNPESTSGEVSTGNTAGSGTGEAAASQVSSGASSNATTASNVTIGSGETSNSTGNTAVSGTGGASNATAGGTGGAPNSSGTSGLGGATSGTPSGSGAAGGSTTASSNSVASSSNAASSNAASSSNTASSNAASSSSSAASSTASSSSSSSGGGTPPGEVYSQCRFHFGTTEGIAKNNPAMTQQLDFFTPGWMGQSDTFDMKYVCDETKAGATFANQVPAIVAYLAAFYVKRHFNLKDCNAPGAQQDLCVFGAQYIQQSLTSILQTYQSYAKGFAACYGTTRPIIFMMEPDFYQYTISNQNQPWTPAHAGQLMTQFVMAIKEFLPNAVFSLDISPWVGPSNGGDNGKSWYSNFDMSLFTFINTSGGGTDATSTKIRSSNAMTWAGVHQVTGKPIMADTGYGVNGSSAGPDPNWDKPANINARMADGVVSISQYNPAGTWGSTISGIRPQLNKQTLCP